MGERMIEIAGPAGESLAIVPAAYDTVPAVPDPERVGVYLTYQQAGYRIIGYQGGYPYDPQGPERAVAGLAGDRRFDEFTDPTAGPELPAAAFVAPEDAPGAKAPPAAPAAAAAKAERAGAPPAAALPGEGKE